MSKKVLAKLAALESNIARLTKAAADIRAVVQAEVDKAEGAAVKSPAAKKPVSKVAKKVEAVAKATEKVSKQATKNVAAKAEAVPVAKKVKKSAASAA